MTGVSGAERHLLELTTALRSCGWSSDVLIPSPPHAELGAFPGALAGVCDRVWVEVVRPTWGPRLLRRIVALLNSGRYDVAHAHLVHADWILSAASLFARPVPLVSSKHNLDPFRRLVPFRVVETAAMRRYREVIAISDSLCDFTRRYVGTSVKRVHYGLQAPETLHRRLVNPVPGRLLAVGRLERQKGFDLLVRSMLRIREAEAEAHLVIAGDGKERAALERQIDELELGNAVTLLGRREDVDVLMREAYALVHPARWEGFGLVLLEAMREGLPIVATRVSAIPEIVEDSATGILVDPGDTDCLADAILRLLREPELAVRLGAAGFRRLREHFSPGRMARETVEAYESALSAHR
jgi:glycosyltransferase involved in cell wall biosynthesis